MIISISLSVSIMSTPISQNNPNRFSLNSSSTAHHNHNHGVPTPKSYLHTVNHSNYLQCSKRSNALNNSNIQFQSNDQSDYEIVTEFQLRREREKTRILEERLHNKEIFIQQMKDYQEELVSAFEKCQQELLLANRKLDYLHLIQRDHLEEIADLKHLVIRLEDQITLKQATLANNRAARRHYSSVKADREGHSDEEELEKVSQRKILKMIGRQKRSKTLMNEEGDSPKGLLKDHIEEEMIQESRKITKFLKQFLMMSQCFLGEIQNGPLKYRLKLAWKWIKLVVKQWNENSKEKQIWEQFIVEVSQKLKVNEEGDVEQKLKKIVKAIKMLK